MWHGNSAHVRVALVLFSGEVLQLDFLLFFHFQEQSPQESKDVVSTCLNFLIGVQKKPLVLLDSDIIHCLMHFKSQFSRQKAHKINNDEEM